MAGVTYQQDSNLAVRLWNHAELGLRKNIQEHDKNLMEKIGDAGLWPMENLPRILWNTAKDPRIITIVVTSFAMLADSYGFYPEETSAFVKAACALLPTIPYWAVKFSAYLTTNEVIAAKGLRMEGRFTNKALMDRFYGNRVDA